MSRTDLWRGRSRGLAVLLFAVTVPSAVTFVWMAVRLIQQDRVVLASVGF